MFGSEALALYVDTVLAARTAVVAAVGDRRLPLSVLPPKTATPALLYYGLALSYGGPVDSTGPIGEEEGDFVVRLICDGGSTQPIRAAAWDMLRALNTDYPSGTVTIDGIIYAVTFEATGEWPQTTLFENSVLYRCLGTIFRASVMIGG